MSTPHNEYAQHETHSFSIRNYFSRSIVPLAFAAGFTLMAGCSKTPESRPLPETRMHTLPENNLQVPIVKTSTEALGTQTSQAQVVVPTNGGSTILQTQLDNAYQQISNLNTLNSNLTAKVSQLTEEKIALSSNYLSTAQQRDALVRQVSQLESSVQSLGIRPEDPKVIRLLNSRAFFWPSCEEGLGLLTTSPDRVVKRFAEVSYFKNPASAKIRDLKDIQEYGHAVMQLFQGNIVIAVDPNAFQNMLTGSHAFTAPEMMDMMNNSLDSLNYAAYVSALYHYAPADDHYPNVRKIPGISDGNAYIGPVNELKSMCTESTKKGGKNK